MDDTESKKKYIKAIICASQRSGTTAFHSVLKANEIFCPGEIFHPERKSEDAFHTFLATYGDISYREYLANPRLVWDEYSEYLIKLAEGRDVIVDIKYNSWHQFNGTWHQPVQAPRLLSYLDPNTWVIHIVRRNIFDQVMSGFVAQERGKFHSNEVEDITALRFSVNIKSFQNRFNLIQEASKKYEEWLSKRKRVQTLYYEDMFAEDRLTEETLEKMLAMGIDLNTLKTQLRKPRSDYKLMVTNYSELEDTFKLVA